MIIQNKNLKLILIFLACVAFLNCASSNEIIYNLPEKEKKYPGKENFYNQREIIDPSGNIFSILFLGDIYLVNMVEEAIFKNGKSYPFEKIKDELLNYTFVFANIESPICGKGNPVEDKAFVFKSNPEIAESLLGIKLDAVSIANNHILDYGIEGLKDTICFLEYHNIFHTGAGADLDSARKPAMLKYGDTQVYILAYSERPPDKYFAWENSPGTAPLILDNIIEDIKKYKTGKNIVLVSLHWGIELRNTPRLYQRDIAHRIIEAGADGIIGHHPHWSQGIELYKKKPVIYSLGNFISGFYSIEEKDNIITAFYYTRNKLTRIEIKSLAGINKDTGFQPYIIHGKEAEENLKRIKLLSQDFNTNIRISGDIGLIEVNK